MSTAGLFLMWIGPFLAAVALAVGLIVLFGVVRPREKRRREMFLQQQAQADQRRAQEDELKRMKIDDL